MGRLNNYSWNIAEKILILKLPNETQAKFKYKLLKNKTFKLLQFIIKDHKLKKINILIERN